MTYPFAFGVQCIEFLQIQRDFDCVDIAREDSLEEFAEGGGRAKVSRDAFDHDGVVFLRRRVWIEIGSVGIGLDKELETAYREVVVFCAHNNDINERGEHKG